MYISSRPTVGRIGTSPKKCCGVGAASHTIGIFMHILEICSLCCGRRTNNTCGDIMGSTICIFVKLYLANWNWTEDIDKEGTACYWTCFGAAILNGLVARFKEDEFRTNPLGAWWATNISLYLGIASLYSAMNS